MAFKFAVDRNRHGQKVQKLLSKKPSAPLSRTLSVPALVRQGVDAESAKRIAHAAIQVDAAKEEFGDRLQAAFVFGSTARGSLVLRGKKLAPTDLDLMLVINCVPEGHRVKTLAEQPFGDKMDVHHLDANALPIIMRKNKLGTILRGVLSLPTVHLTGHETVAALRQETASALEKNEEMLKKDAEDLVEKHSKKHLLVLKKAFEREASELDARAEELEAALARAKTQAKKADLSAKISSLRASSTSATKNAWAANDLYEGRSPNLSPFQQRIMGSQVLRNWAVQKLGITRVVRQKTGWLQSQPSAP